jgi:hypothetical protein
MSHVATARENHITIATLTYQALLDSDSEVNHCGANAIRMAFPKIILP